MNEEPGLLEVQENNTMITFGRKLKHLRQKNHLTQKELGMAVGFPESCADVRISQYESDVRTPKEDLMKLFASKLGVPVELFTVPVLSESREYEVLGYWCFGLGAEGDFVWYTVITLLSMRCLSFLFVVVLSEYNLY